MPEEKPKTKWEEFMESQLERKFGSYRSSTMTPTQLKERDQYQAQQMYIRERKQDLGE